MGIKNIITDDLTGDTLEDGAKPIDVRVDGEDYQIFLSDESKETFIALLKGEAPLLQRTARAPKRKAGAGRKPVNTYGYDFNEVRAHAIAKGLKSKAGTPITEETRVLNQSVYDDFKAAQKK